MNVMKMIGAFTNCLESFSRRLDMSPFKKAAVKGGSSKGKEPVIDVDDYPPQTKETRSSSKRFDPNKFRSYAAYQSHENYFQNAKPLLERTVDQSSLTFQNGLLTRTGITFSLIWMTRMKIW